MTISVRWLLAGMLLGGWLVWLYMIRPNRKPRKTYAAPNISRLGKPA